MSYGGVIRRYSKYLPFKEDVEPVTLLEGDTPLLEADNLRHELKAPCKLFLKFEGANPTGSFKDRGMTVAITEAVQSKAEVVICASTGNTSASAAAYAAKAKLKAFVILPKGKIALGKMAQALIYGAQVIEIDGNFDEALRIVREIGSKTKAVIVNSINPFRIEGQKTASFEILETLGSAPTHHALPVGNAGNITAYWKGYKEWASHFPVAVPKMLGFQAEGAAPIVHGMVVDHPETVATAIRIGNPASWKQAVQALDESKGQINIVSDAEILSAQKLIASTEGIFCEPASASSVAGVRNLVQRNFFTAKDVVVCTLTGNGLKDPDTASRDIPQPIQSRPIFSEVLKLMDLKQNG
ncbi:MAG TPA: threonine synthase [Candidatus Kryptonia bacterium]